MKILIADDQAVNRLLLEKLLAKTNSELLFAKNGLEAVNIYKEVAPDLILMDIMMPVMGGIDAIKEIRALSSEKLVQIIVISALTDEESVVEGLNVGADDYISKPFNTVILNAKILAVSRTVQLQTTLLESKQKLEQYHKNNEHELDFSKRVFEKITAQNDLKDPQLDYWIKPSARFSGDLISAKRVSESQLYFMLADSTGHGLSAALPTIIVSQLFQAMVKKGVSIASIVRAINHRLKQDLPIGHFVALAAGVVDTEKRSIEIWNGGLPAIPVLNDNNEIVESFLSKHVFCGILNDSYFSDETETWCWQEKCELLLCSDGVTDVVNKQGEIFGDERFMTVLLSTHAKQRIEGIKEQLVQFIDPSQEQDDVSCLSIYCS